jgi:putative nucleotidyltransferase with HDIG domain
VSQNMIQTTVTRTSPRAILLDAVVAATEAAACEETITRLWAHASEVARLARDLAPLADVDPFEAASAGLLHDIGELVMLATRPIDFARVLAEHPGHADQLAVEKATFGYDHALRGAEHVLDHRVAHEIADAVADHHDPFRDSEPTTIVVAAADEIATGDPARRHAQDLLGLDAASAAVLLGSVRSAGTHVDPFRS